MDVTSFTWQELDAGARRDPLRRPALLPDGDVSDQASKIVGEVQANGDQALRKFSRQFDDVELESFEVGPGEFELAERRIPASARDAIDIAIRNVARFHEAQKPLTVDIETMPGIRCQRISRAIATVGLYVPAGSAPLPSAAIMLAVPASLAGCRERIMCTPPNAEGLADPAVLIAARRSGVDRVFKVGGAQAIAAMAYGTESVPRVNKIFGPGNAWVTAAKSIVSMDPQGAAIDLPAGPSELMVIADSSASAEFVAADLLSQAEHGADSQVILLTTCAELIGRVRQQLCDQSARLSRRDTVHLSLRNSRLILVKDIGTAIDICNDYAPEHLILQVDQPRKSLPQIRNAGSVFLGPWSPESAGDYCSGANHVLPTCGAARAYSGLGLDQFLRQMTVQELSIEGISSISAAVVELATLEGLDAHANAVNRRMERIGRQAKAS